jgi:hypothetical protein
MKQMNVSFSLSRTLIVFNNTVPCIEVYLLSWLSGMSIVLSLTDSEREVCLSDDTVKVILKSVLSQRLSISTSVD